jgi:hypothetical protein
MNQCRRSRIAGLQEVSGERASTTLRQPKPWRIFGPGPFAMPWMRPASLHQARATLADPLGKAMHSHPDHDSSHTDGTAGCEGSGAKQWRQEAAPKQPEAGSRTPDISDGAGCVQPGRLHIAPPVAHVQGRQNQPLRETREPKSNRKRNRNRNRKTRHERGLERDRTRASLRHGKTSPCDRLAHETNH